jgi:hypothetical protein
MSKTLRILAILGTITGGIANLGVIPLVPSTLSVFIIALSLALHQVIDVIGDFLDNGKKDWRSPLVIGALIIGGLSLASLTGCATAGSASPGTSSGASSTGTVTTSSSASADIEAALPLVRTGAAVATGAVLDFAVQQQGTRTRLANEMYSAASAVYSLSGGTFPTPAQFSASILSFGGSQADANYAQFSTAISALYAAYYPKLVVGDTKTATDLLNAIAGGIEDATASYVSTPATSSSTGTTTPTGTILL